MKRQEEKFKACFTDFDGKFKGRLVRNLPSPYLRWVAENWKEDTETNRNIIATADEEYQERKKHNTHHLYE